MMLGTAVDALEQHSIDTILAGQADSGAYVACPSFSQYGYSWLRDGSFCALAMASVGQRESAYRFHRWAVGTVHRHREHFLRATADLSLRRDPDAAWCPPTRFNLDGSIEEAHDSAWPNYQLDGYGTWLTVLEQFAPGWDDATSAAVRLVADLLAAGWQHACYDCWEEAGDEVHASTLLAVGGGLRAASRMLNEPHYENAYASIRDVIERDFVTDGMLRKRRNDKRVDASLGWAALPHGFYAPTDPLVLRTVDQIVAELGAPGRGIRRYLGDSYYGGGDWVLLAGLIGWQDARAGNRARWAELLAWIRGTASERGDLPEQTLQAVQDPAFVQRWQDLWGPVAEPLLWSHAMYLLMVHEGKTQGWH